MGPTYSNLTSLIEHLALDIAQEQLTSQRLSALMTDHFGGTDASGAWTWRQAYDAMEAGFVKAMLEMTRLRPASAYFDMLMHLAAKLPTETRRSETQIRLQQFSTPLPYAFVASRAAAFRNDDPVLEPSAGTGALALAPAKQKLTVSLNEIDPFRAALLKTIFGQNPTAHDGEYIDDALPGNIAPSVVLMNPPFSSSQSRSGDASIAARHLISAAKRLAAGGRLVAIMPVGFTPEHKPDWWRRLRQIITPRMSIALPGQVYRKMGTNVETQLIICDKVTDDAHPFHRVKTPNLKTALDLVINELPPRGSLRHTSGPASSAHPVPEPMAVQPIVSKPRTTARRTPAMPSNIAPVAFCVFDTPKTNPAVSDIYASYAPQRIGITGAQEHPTPLVESIAMASVVPPPPEASLRLPRKITELGLLSEAQLETVIMANDAHARDVPGRFVIDEDHTQITRADDDPTAQACRMGYFLGDGTGCGKGRQVAALILANWLAGRRRAIWVSKSATLIEDAIRDWRDLGGSPTDIQPLSKWKPDAPITMDAGILFVTYATLRAHGKDGTTRLAQVLDWAGADFDGVVAFDEAHAMANAAGSTEGRGTKPSQQGLAGLRLQIALPRARVFYVSATGATTVANLAYASRLGLWGPGPGYPLASREQFVASMEAGGVAAMEVVARDLKALGLYTARALSFEGVEYDILEHCLTEDQIAIYNAYASGFKTIHANLHKALEATGVVDPDGGVQSTASKASAMSRFESAKQRFFNHLLLGMKTPSIIAAIETDVADGWAPVIQIVSTGESLLKRRLETMDADDTLVEGALTPRDYIIAYLEQAFPIHAQKLVEIDGNIVAEPLRDGDDNLVVSREAVALRDATIEDLMCLAPIPSALDQILWHFGEDAVAEITGRSVRPLRGSDGQLTIQKRSASANSSETAAFMDGEKSILIFSDAGGTGRSYHAAQSAKNQKRRRHYLLEPGWRADAAIQGLGRSHRSAQVSAPFFRVCTTDVHGEKRFTSTISARLDTLGALSKGQRETGTQGMFRPEDNLQSPIARSALRALYADFVADRAASMSCQTFTDWTALRLTDNEGVMLEDLPPIQRFLNRVLALPIHMQNALFEEFMERIALQTERARAAGTLDLGVETLRGDKIAQVSVEDLWTCPKTKAITQIVGLDVTDAIHIPSARETIGLYSPGRCLMINRASGKVAAISKRPFQVYDDDVLTLMRRVARPKGDTMVTEAAFEKSTWKPVEKASFLRLWDDEADALPRVETTKIFLLTGLLLPIWTKIPSQNERIYRVIPEGGTAMIGRALHEDQAASLRARFMTESPTTPAEIVTKAIGTSGAVELGQGLRLVRRRVAGAVRLEIEGADRAMIDHLKSLGCFTEIIAFQLRLFVPHGDGVDTQTILAKIVGQEPAPKSEKAA